MQTKEKQIESKESKLVKATTVSKIEELLNAKKEEMRNYVNVMKLYTRQLTFEESQEITNIEMRMEFALKKLVLETRLQEAEMKLKAMKDTLNVVKGIKKL